jgi:gliding motility-associated-like protein
VKTAQIIFTFLFPILLLGQGADNCINATVLCANQTQFSGNEGASVSACTGCEDGNNSNGNFCYSLNNTVWFSFTTNAIGGDVAVSVANINCNQDPGYNNSLQGVIISASSPCNESTYNAVSNCTTSSNNFTLSANGLSPNTTYYVQIDGDSINGDTNPAACGFNINVSGPGVEIEIDAGEGSTIFKGETAALEGSGPSNSTWTPVSSFNNPNVASNTVSPITTTTYFYTTVTDDGCIYSDAVTVVVQESINITNTFSPNDDGINDFWYVGSMENFPSAKVTIFDRWGQKVFYSVGYSNDNVWTGKSNGISVPSGVYYYIIDLNTDSDEDTFAGYVTVVK